MKNQIIETKMLSTVRKFSLLKKGESVGVAVSGGCDSVTLLKLLSEIKTKLDLKICILHLNHMLRGKSSKKDQDFVCNIAKKYGIEFYTTSVNVENQAKMQRISIEEAARNARYEFFEHIIQTKKIQKIATAHHRDDQAETVLMRIITGTGLQGLQAIRPKRKLGEGYIIRPLIEISRKKIEQYVKQEKLKYRKDKTNQSLQFLRNKIRLKLIPFLERDYNPKIKKVLARLPHLLDVDLNFLDETADVCYQRLASKRHPDEIVFPRKSFLKLKPSIQYRLLNRALKTLSGAELDFEHWSQFLEKLSSEKAFKLQMPRNMIVLISQEHVCLTRNSKFKGFVYRLNKNARLYIPEIDQVLECKLMKRKMEQIHKKDSSFESFDHSKLSFPLTIRTRKAGDRFQPLGQNKPMKLKNFLINKKIPMELRDRLPLVISGKKIIWIAGIGMSDLVKIDKNTKEVLEICLQK